MVRALPFVLFVISFLVACLTSTTDARLPTPKTGRATTGLRVFATRVLGRAAATANFNFHRFNKKSPLALPFDATLSSTSTPLTTSTSTAPPTDVLLSNDLALTSSSSAVGMWGLSQGGPRKQLVRFVSLLAKPPSAFTTLGTRGYVAYYGLAGLATYGYLCLVRWVLRRPRVTAWRHRMHAKLHGSLAKLRHWWRRTSSSSSSHGPREVPHATRTVRVRCHPHEKEAVLVMPHKEASTVSRFLSGLRVPVPLWFVFFVLDKPALLVTVHQHSAPSSSLPAAPVCTFQPPSAMALATPFFKGQAALGAYLAIIISNLIILLVIYTCVRLRLDPEWIVFKRTRTAADKHAVDASTLTQSQADAPSPEEEDDTVVIENRLEDLNADSALFPDIVAPAHLDQDGVISGSSGVDTSPIDKKAAIAFLAAQHADPLRGNPLIAAAPLLNRFQTEIQRMEATIEEAQAAGDEAKASKVQTEMYNYVTSFECTFWRRLLGLQNWRKRVLVPGVDVFKYYVTYPYNKEMQRMREEMLEVLCDPIHVAPQRRALLARMGPHSLALRGFDVQQSLYATERAYRRFARDYEGFYGQKLNYQHWERRVRTDEIELRDRTAPQPTGAEGGSQSGAAHVGDDGPDLVDL